MRALKRNQLHIHWVSSSDADAERDLVNVDSEATRLRCTDAYLRAAQNWSKMRALKRNQMDVHGVSVPDKLSSSGHKLKAVDARHQPRECFA